MTSRYERALGSLLGSFVGDAFGAQTEFKRQKDVARLHPRPIREMEGSPRSVGRPGEVTDDSEMVIMMIQSIIGQGRYSQSQVRKAYQRWRNSGPESIGITICSALDGYLNSSSQANGALMRCSPLGVLGCTWDTQQILRLSDLDCTITHIHPVARDCNRLWILALSLAIEQGLDAATLYAKLRDQAESLIEEPIVLEALHKAEYEVPEGIDGNLKGWVLIAFQLAWYTVLHAPNFEEGMIEITMRAGDADTNATIYGALAGALWGVESIPLRWSEALKLTTCLKNLMISDESTVLQLAKTWTQALLHIGSSTGD